jgi:hypothetical protein
VPQNQFLPSAQVRTFRASTTKASSAILDTSNSYAVDANFMAANIAGPSWCGGS